MALKVREIMNVELFKVGEDERVDDVLEYIVALGITGAPVVDGNDTLVGFVSWRDLVTGESEGTLVARMSVPAHTIDADADIADAAGMLCELGHHHLVCVDKDGHPVGFVGSLDVLRGLTGRPVAHPDTFPRWDPNTGLQWSSDARLDSAAVRQNVRNEPGLFVLILPGSGAPDRVVWSGAVVDVRETLLEILEVPYKAPPHLASLIEHGQLWFRAAAAPSLRALNDAVAATR